MAFAAARMLKEKKDQENRKKSTGISRSTSRTMNKVSTAIGLQESEALEQFQKSYKKELFDDFMQKFVINHDYTSCLQNAQCSRSPSISSSRSGSSVFSACKVGDCKMLKCFAS